MGQINQICRIGIPRFGLYPNYWWRFASLPLLTTAGFNGQASARNGVCRPSTMSSPRDWAWWRWISIRSPTNSLCVTRTQCGSSVICCYFGITSGFLLSKVVYVFFKCLCHSISISLKPSYSMRLAAAGRLREKISKMWPSLHPAFHDRGHNQEVFSETKWH